MLYEVAVIDRDSNVIALLPTPVIAEDEKSASAIVFLENAETLRAVAKSTLEILVRPFAG